MYFIIEKVSLESHNRKFIEKIRHTEIFIFVIRKAFSTSQTYLDSHVGERLQWEIIFCSLSDKSILVRLFTQRQQHRESCQLSQDEDLNWSSQPTSFGRNQNKQRGQTNSLSLLPAFRGNQYSEELNLPLYTDLLPYLAWSSGSSLHSFPV